MPIYEYTCDQCGARFEKLHRQLGQPPSTPPCPHCKSDETQRIMSTFAQHGEPGIDHEAVRAERAQAERAASITPKSLIDKWRSADTKG
jgi:putative FmdB family regulatory protein